MNEITEKILNLCFEKNIPVSKLEKDLGFSNRYIASTGKSLDFPFKKLVAICKYLNVPIWYFDNELELDVKNRLLSVLNNKEF